MQKVKHFVEVKKTVVIPTQQYMDFRLTIIFVSLILGILLDGIFFEKNYGLDHEE